MTSGKIPYIEARLVYGVVRRSLGYLERLQARMQRLGIPPDDKLFHLTAKAYGALNSLSTELLPLMQKRVG
jgi:hypothetical protein